MQPGYLKYTSSYLTQPYEKKKKKKEGDRKRAAG